MKLANHDGRLVLVLADGIVDVAEASAGRFSPDPQSIYERWDELRAWRAPTTPTGPLDEAALLAPVPFPRQVFAIGINYAGHAAEAGLEHPRVPAHVHEVPDLPHRAVRHGRAAERVRRLGGGARPRRRPARLRGRPRATAGRTSPA